MLILLSSYSFSSDPPTFTLVSVTDGGPPTTYTWTRNGQDVTSNASYSISLQVEQSFAGFQNSQYCNTLTVTGVLPGVYQYSVTNRATSGMVTDQFTIEGIRPLQLIFLHNTFGKDAHNASSSILCVLFGLCLFVCLFVFVPWKIC